MRTKAHTTSLLLLAGALLLAGTAWAQPNAPTMMPEPEFTMGLSNTVSWTSESASGAVQYFVGASPDSTFPDPQQLELSSGWISGTTYTFNNVLQDGVKYYYRVRARNAALQMSPWSQYVFSTQDARGPNPVTDLEAEGRYEYVRLTWTPVQDAGVGLAFYRVYRSTAMGELGGRIDAGDGTVTVAFFGDQTAEPGITYWYTVRPVDLFGQETLEGNKQDDAAIIILGDPSLQITWPPDHYVTCAESIDVRGVFFNTLSIWVNGKPARMTLDPVAGEFSALGIPLVMGPNSVVASGNGSFGRATSFEITVVRLPTCEGAPALTITSPEEGSAHPMGTVQVAGTVELVGAVKILDQWAEIQFSPDFTSGTFTFPDYPLDRLGELTIEALGYGTPAPGELEDRQVSDQVTVYVVAPGQLSVQITDPADGFVTTARAVDVAGTFQGAYAVEVNGIAATLDANALTFRCAAVPLQLGPNQIRAVAFGPGGTTAEDVITVYVVSGTNVAVDITFPPDRYVTTQRSLTVTGTSSNAGWIEVGYPGTSVIAVPDLATGAWSAALSLPAPYAMVTITATAHGAAGTAQDQVTVYVVASEAASISITYPEDGTALNVSPITVTGIAQHVGFVEVNGLPAQYVPPNFQCPLTLTSGWNTIVARGYGATTTVVDSVRVWYEPGCAGDPGSIAILAPADSSVTTAAAIEVTGSSRCIRAVTVNEVRATLDYATGAWTAASVPLRVGMNTITATGTNYAGSTVTATVRVFRVAGSEPPTIAITRPTQGQEFAYAESLIAVEGTSRNLAWVRVNGLPVTTFDPVTGAWALSGFRLVVGDNEITAVGRGTVEVRASVTVRRLPLTPPPAAQFHAIITPNGDGYNDVANIPVPSRNSTVTIFTRDGQEVVSLSTVDATYSQLFIHWDGRDREGRVVPSGLYIYQVKDQGGTTTGTVVVAR